VTVDCDQVIWLSDEGDRPSCSAALEKLPCSATATIARSSVFPLARIQKSPNICIAFLPEPEQPSA